MADTITLEVMRYEPDGEGEPTVQEYEVPLRRDWAVLDGLNHVKDNLDGSLSYRWSCRMGICGSCGMTINGGTVTGNGVMFYNTGKDYNPDGSKDNDGPLAAPDTSSKAQNNFGSVSLGGNAVIHQNVRVGRLVIMSGDCGIGLDVPPFCMVSERNRIGGLNLVGLRRAGIPRDHITEIRRAFRDLLRNPMPRSEIIAELRARAASCPPLSEMADFIAATKRGITPGMGKRPRGAARSTSSWHSTLPCRGPKQGSRPAPKWIRGWEAPGRAGSWRTAPPRSPGCAGLRWRRPKCSPRRISCSGK